MLRRNFLTVIGAAMIAGTAMSPAKAADMDIVDTAVANGSFTTLVAAVQAAGLVDTLKGKGPFTVFAPTDEAFAALPDGTVETLLKPENKDQLVQILTYHVVPAKVMSGELAGKRTKVLTVEGERLSVNGMGNGVKVGSSKVVAADVGASNGVIHVIDKVLIPEG
ncbi:fasciclin domain-containing protein [Sedimentitalea todarodis]|uniref:Fasciclin domain-containing protein n=1 Tax=Sedimentitalea todarodis TaxID=1631240 RepID=A0ABU3VD23_9RHOB|nr:fasciclin domain-containing protein [Sedimentitalea todarodis]MDU9004061.1 fasciclin domain-containing protein [Sedimentitalea todarodis]